MKKRSIRLDANETLFLRGQLESIDQELYKQIYPDNLSRLYIPTQDGIPEWARTYTWRMFDQYGEAKIVGSSSDDVPRAGLNMTSGTKTIKDIAMAYGWSIMDIKAAAATGLPLDQMEAMAARLAIEQKIDEILATGLTDHNLDGFVNRSDIATSTPIVKTGGGTTWANGTPDEIVTDVGQMIKDTVAAMKGHRGAVFRRFVLLLPTDQHVQLSVERMGDGSNATMLSYLLQSVPYLEAIEPWERLDGAGSGSTDRAMLYPRNKTVVAGIVPREFDTTDFEPDGLEMVVNAFASCGGTVVRYPVACRYMDGI